MITIQEFSILSRIARLVVNNHLNGRLAMAKKKLVSPESKKLAEQIERKDKATSKLALEMLAAAESQFGTKAELVN